MLIDSFNHSFETKNKKENNEKQESKSEKKERLIIFWLKHNWITYKWLKLKIRELQENKKILKEFPDDKELRKKVEKLEKAINSQAKIITVKEWDTLRNLCKNYYGKWSVSTMILIPELGYKEKIKIWENLPLPLKKYILPLIKGNSGDKTKETTTHPEPKKPEENKPEQAEQSEHKETNQTKQKFDIDSIDIEDTKQDVLDTKTAKETFENGKIDAIQQWLLIDANYIATYANNLEFVKITFRDDLQRNFLQASKNIIKQIQNIKTSEDLNKLYQKNLKYFENNLIFGNEVFWNERIINQFKSVINACKNWLKTDLKINNQENISKQEIIKQVSNIKWEIFQTIRKIDETDDGILIKDSWNYEANFHNQTLNHILTETNLIKPEQLADISKIQNFDYNKLLNDFLNKKEIKDNQTETEILQNNYYLLELQNYLSQLNISEDLKQELLEDSNNFFKEHFEKWYEKEIKKLAKQKYEQEKWIKQDFEIYYQDILEKYKQTSLQQYKLFIWEKLTNYYLQNIDKNKLIQQSKEDKLVDLYTKIHGLWEYKISDETETKMKFRSKEVAIQTAMLIPAIRIWNIPVKLALWWMERTAKVKLVDYAMSTFTFTQAYNIEDIVRKDHVDDKKTFWEKYYESLKDRKTLWKNFILLGWMKYLQEVKIVEKVETMTKSQILQKLGNNYNILGKFLWKVNGTATETVTAISLMEGWTLIFDQKNISKEDMVFALAMVLSLKATWKWEEKNNQKTNRIKNKP